MYKLIIIILIFIPFISFSQNIKLKVASDGENLAYANISVNGKWIGYADSLGIFTIEKDKLTIGDTITVNYIGCDKSDVIYNGNDNDMVIKLSHGVEIDEVVVTGLKNPTRFFDKDVKYPTFVKSYAMFNMNLEIISSLKKINNYDNANISIVYNHDNKQNNEKYHYLSCSFDNDTLTKTRIAQIFRDVMLCVPQSSYYMIKVRNHTIEYLGRKEDLYLFSIKFKRFDFRNYIYGINKETNTIEFIETLYVNDKYNIYQTCYIEMSAVAKNEYYIVNFKYDTKTKFGEIKVNANNITTSSYQKKYSEMSKENRWELLYPQLNKQ